MTTPKPDLEQMRLAALNSMKNKNGYRVPAQNYAPVMPASNVMPPMPVPMMGMDVMQSRLNPRPIPSKDKELKEAISDLQKLGLNFYDIQAQCKANPAFLSHVFQSLEMMVPSSVTQPMAPIEPLLRSFIPPRQASASGNSMSPRENESKPKAMNAPQNPTPPAVAMTENVPPVKYSEKRKGSPSEPVYGQRQAPVKRARFGDDRWSHNLCIEISDGEEYDAETRAPTPLEVKKAEIKRMTALLEKIEREKKLREKLRNGRNGDFVPLEAQSSPVSPKPASTPRPTAPRRAESEGARTVNPEIIQLELKRQEAKERQEAISKENVALYSKVEGFKKLALEVERLKRQLMEKMDLKVKADVENVEVEAKLSMNKAEHLRIESELQMVDEQIKSLQKTQPFEPAEVMTTEPAEVGSTELSEVVSTDSSQAVPTEPSQVASQLADMVASDNDAMDFEEIAPVIEAQSSSEEASPNMEAPVQVEVSQGAPEQKKVSEELPSDDTSDSVTVQEQLPAQRESDDGRGTASQPIVLSESSDELEQDQEGDIAMGNEPKLKTEPVEADSVEREGDREAEGPNTKEQEEEEAAKKNTNPLEDEREKFNKEILNLHLEKPKAYRRYESPLRYFRSFKFSPFYADQVSGGLNSATYNSKIPSDMELCESEAQGRPCHNPDCTGFHFKDAAQDDQTILQELSRAFVGETSEQVEEYKKGLATMIIEKKKAQETTNNDRTDADANPSLQFEDTAEALVEYRRAKAKDRILDWYKFRNIKSKKSS